MRLTEPDSRAAALRSALTVLPRLTLAARLLHPTIAAGATAVVLAQTLPSAAFEARVLDPGGQQASGVSRRLQRGERGQWRVLLAVGMHVRPGSLQVVLTARLGGQMVRREIALRVVLGMVGRR